MHDIITHCSKSGLQDTWPEKAVSSLSSSQPATKIINVIIDENAGEAVLRFDFDKTIVQLIKTIPGKWWLPEDKIWTIPLRPDTITYLTKLFKGIAECSFSLSLHESKPDIKQTSAIKTP